VEREQLAPAAERNRQRRLERLDVGEAFRAELRSEISAVRMRAGYAAARATYAARHFLGFRGRRFHTSRRLLRPAASIATAIAAM